MEGDAWSARQRKRMRGASIASGSDWRERTGHLNRIKALLITHGIRALRITDAKWCERLDKMRTGDGRPIPARLKIEMEREWKRLKVVAEQVREVEAECNRLVKGSEPSGDACTEKMRRLVKLHGIGAEFVTREVFYRPFQNRRQVASYIGLTPAPYDSRDTKHDQGINKAGNTRARVIAVQMAWLWLRYQSKSELSLWYYGRVGDLKGRVRRIMIIALARKLVIALWRYVDTGRVPTGANGSSPDCFRRGSGRSVCRRCSWRSDRDPNGPRPLTGSVERSLGREIERAPARSGVAPLHSTAAERRREVCPL
jgi:hypothetical protein